MVTEARLLGILHITQKPHLSGSPVKEPSLKLSFIKFLAERCSPPIALIQSSIKDPVYEPLTPAATYQFLSDTKGHPAEG